MNCLSRHFNRDFFFLNFEINKCIMMPGSTTNISTGSSLLKLHKCNATHVDGGFCFFCYAVSMEHLPCIVSYSWPCVSALKVMPPKYHLHSSPLSYWHFLKKKKNQSVFRYLLNNLFGNLVWRLDFCPQKNSHTCLLYENNLFSVIT